MALYTPHPNTRRTLDASKAWRERCLLHDGSLFSAEPLWTRSNLTTLERAFSSNPLQGTDSFYTKLARQLDGVPSPIRRLAAECLWLLLLFVSSEGYSASLKRQRVADVWALSGEDLPDSELLKPEPLDGIGWPGTAFLTRIPDEFGFLLLAMAAWKGLPSEGQQGLLSEGEPWAFCEWLTSQPGGDRRIFRHILLYLLFPTHFERICSRKQKRDVYAAFSRELGAEADFSQDPRTPCELDRALLKIRGLLEQKHDSTELDFYNDPLKNVWGFGAQQAAEPASEAASMATRFWIEKTIVAGRPDRQSGDNALGRSLWSPQKSKNGADIYANMSHVRPGDVIFHLTDNAGITDVSLAAGGADSSFRGVPGTEWADQDGYRIALTDHQRLTPPLLREGFLATEPYATELRELVESGAKGLFFNRKLELNQGAYLTEATPSLISILNRAYQELAGRPLPYVGDVEAPAVEEDGVPAYTLEHALEELFLDDGDAEEILLLWRAKKNVILQGPPGVGKSFAAKRLGFALMGAKDPSRLGFVQFHQSYSYEDFVEGFRPTATGFELKPGKFVEFCRRAEADPTRTYVFVIDEINRGNLSKIMGELMLLIESDKRAPEWAMPLASGKAPFHVPANVYLLGLMNTADRSLAVVDYALRRRFAFVDLAPNLSSPKFRSQLVGSGVGELVVDRVLDRVGALNAEIVGDVTNLGPGFAIGHSFFCGRLVDGEADTDWYERVIRTEIAPLLREYWFDAPNKAEQWTNQLLAS